MSTRIECLLSLQEVDTRIRRMERELREIPAKKAALENRLDTRTAALSEAREELRRKQTSIKELELDSQSEEEKVSRLRQQQMQLTTNKEFKAMDHEIAALTARIREIEDRELDLLEEAEEITSTIAGLEEDLARDRDQVACDAGEFDQRSRALEAALESARAERDGLARRVDPEWLVLYERVFAKREPAVVPVENSGVCGGCHMTMPPFIRHDARKQDELVFCQFCGRIVYAE